MLGAASPQLAAKIPDQLGTAVARMERSRAGRSSSRLHALWGRIRWVTRVLLLVGPLVLHRRNHAAARSPAGVGPGWDRADLWLACSWVCWCRWVGSLLSGRCRKDPGARAALFRTLACVLPWAVQAGPQRWPEPGWCSRQLETSLYEMWIPFNRLKAVLDTGSPCASLEGWQGALGAGPRAVVGTIVLIWPAKRPRRDRGLVRPAAQSTPPCECSVSRSNNASGRAL